VTPLLDSSKLRERLGRVMQGKTVLLVLLNVESPERCEKLLPANIDRGSFVCVTSSGRHNTAWEDFGRLEVSSPVAWCFKHQLLANAQHQADQLKMLIHEEHSCSWAMLSEHHLQLATLLGPQHTC
jgi:hypothetical protein